MAADSIGACTYKVFNLCHINEMFYILLCDILCHSHIYSVDWKHGLALL